jgi:hypothetical protein
MLFNGSNYPVRQALNDLKSEFKNSLEEKVTRLYKRHSLLGIFFPFLPLASPQSIMDNKSSASQRKTAFKNKDTFQTEQVRNRRQQHTVELRKQKREQNLTKRRNFAFDQDMSESDDDQVDASQKETEVSPILERRSIEKMADVLLAFSYNNKFWP